MSSTPGLHCRLDATALIPEFVEWRTVGVKGQILIGSGSPASILIGQGASMPGLVDG